MNWNSEVRVRLGLGLGAGSFSSRSPCQARALIVCCVGWSCKSLSPTHICFSLVFICHAIPDDPYCLQTRVMV